MLGNPHIPSNVMAATDPHLFVDGFLSSHRGGAHGTRLAFIIGCFGGLPPKWMVLLMGNPIEMDDLGVPLFMETLIYSNHFLKWDEHPVVHGIAWV